MYILVDENNYVIAVSNSKLRNGIEIELPNDFNYDYQNCYRLEEKTLVYDSTRETNYKLSELRAERELILKAFDIYKTNVIYGIEQDANREEILKWYQDILDLKETAFNDIPEEIQKYL